MSRLICMVGLPRSGKTTWARKQGFPIVNPDSIRLALHGTAFYKPAEPFVWAIAHLMVRALHMAGCDTVVLDATNVSRKRRDEWNTADYGEVRFHEMTTTSEECLNRATSMELRLVIERQMEAYEPLGEDELRW